MAVYIFGRFLQIYSDQTPILLIIGLTVVPPAIFALMHGARLYRMQAMLVFLTICLFVGNILENLGVRTGFPFGHYHFTDLMGPKFLVVPILLGLAYVGMAYLSWMLAVLIVSDPRVQLSRHSFMTVPLAAAIIMVAWDVSMDPVWSTIMQAWIWQRGGAYFGVPITNFIGWFLTVYVIYQLFAVYLRSLTPNYQSLPTGYWRLSVIFYSLSAAGNFFLLIPHHAITVVTDATGRQWNVGEIMGATALISMFVMGAFAFFAWSKIPRKISDESSPR